MSGNSAKPNLRCCLDRHFLLVLGGRHQDSSTWCTTDRMPLDNVHDKITATGRTTRDCQPTNAPQRRQPCSHPALQKKNRHAQTRTNFSRACCMYGHKTRRTKCHQDATPPPVQFGGECWCGSGTLIGTGTPGTTSLTMPAGNGGGFWWKAGPLGYTNRSLGASIAFSAYVVYTDIFSRPPQASLLSPVQSKSQSPPGSCSP